MNAEQYRALVNKLEAIQEAEDVVGSPTTEPTVQAAPDANAELLKQIEHAPTFKQAYAMAKKAGLKKFKWCQCKEYAVKDAPAQGPMLRAPEQKVDYLGQQDPLGGTMQNPMSFAPNSNFGA